MKDRLTYHPDGEHIIYLDANGAMVSNTEMVIEGRTYRFAANGAMMY